MLIEDYTFGRIVIEGRTFTSDCLIIASEVLPEWWRINGHLLCPEDLRPVIEAAPATLVVGTGASAMMQISELTRRVLRDRNIELQACDTPSAVTLFNRLSESGASVAAALHLTC